MIIGIGVDVCDVRRMARELGRDGSGFRDQVFTPLEVSECNSHRSASAAFASRFAAKEAALKALGTGLIDTGVLREIEVVPDRAAGGAVTLQFHDRVAGLARSRGVSCVRAAFAFAHGCALASVVLESGVEEHAWATP